MKLVIIITTKDYPPGKIFTTATDPRWKQWERTSSDVVVNDVGGNKIILTLESFDDKQKKNNLNVEEISTAHAADEIYVAVHRGLFNEKQAKDKIKTMSAYAPFIHQKKDHIYDALLALLEKPNEANYNALIEEIKKKHELTFARRVTILKHRIAHIFLSIDLDLQGLVEAGFNEDYWSEVVEAYKDGKPDTVFTQTRKLLYKNGDEADWVEKIIGEAEASYSREGAGITEAWKRIQQLLPKTDIPPEHRQVLEILKGLNTGNKQVVSDLCKDANNPFHHWFVELDEALDKLRETLVRSEKQV